MGKLRTRHRVSLGRRDSTCGQTCQTPAAVAPSVALVLRASVTPNAEKRSPPAHRAAGLFGPQEAVQGQPRPRFLSAKHSASGGSGSDPLQEEKQSKCSQAPTATEQPQHPGRQALQGGGSGAPADRPPIPAPPAPCISGPQEPPGNLRNQDPVLGTSSLPLGWEGPTASWSGLSRWACLLGPNSQPQGQC